MNYKSCILLVEDNEQILYGNERMLRRRGYSVMTALTLYEARKNMAETTPDVIILDIMLPDGNGLDFICEIRQDSNIPVLLLTGLTTPEDIVRGLTNGGDDYLTKPYDFEVLLARIEALMRRAVQVPEIVTKGNLCLKIAANQAFIGDEDLLLQKKEFALLLLFTQNEGKTISADYLYEKIWGQPIGQDYGALKNAIYKLRKKISQSGYTISNERNEGYCLEQIGK